MSPRHLPLFALAMLLLSACTGKPAYVLSDKKMENVLFDLYLAEAGVNENFAHFRNDSARQQDFLQSVFKKHKTTQARFDTSLVWYNAHMQRYIKINTQLTARYNQLIHQLEAQAKRRERLLSLSSDTLRFEHLNLKDFTFLLRWHSDPDTLPLLYFLTPALPALPQLPHWQTDTPADTLSADTIPAPLLPVPDLPADTLPAQISAEASPAPTLRTDTLSRPTRTLQSLFPRQAREPVENKSDR